ADHDHLRAVAFAAMRPDGDVARLFGSRKVMRDVANKREAVGRQLRLGEMEGSGNLAGDLRNIRRLKIRNPIAGLLLANLERSDDVHQDEEPAADDDQRGEV